MGNTQIKEMDEHLKRELGRKAELSINGQTYTVGDEVGDMSLNTFIRERANLKGTKFMCLEGGCGACIVSAHFTHPATHKKVTYAVNSCLVPVLVCQGWEITTVEGIGNRFMGYHKVQKRLAAGNGSQCGYCSPGMVVNMYSLLSENANMTMKEIENSFAGNICRCTGYRPILDAFKTFATDAPEELKLKIADIEDIVCPKNGSICTGKCESNCHPLFIERVDVQKALAFEFKNGSKWYRPSTVREIFEIFDMIEGKTYRLVSGNTGQGVYRIDPKPAVYIDINGISELRSSSIASNGIKLGANMSLTETMNLLTKVADKQPGKFAYCKQLVDHMDLIANIPVRNIGTLAGNLSLKHQHREFQSDIFLLLETVGAKVVMHISSGMDKCISLPEYLGTEMNKKVLTEILLPTLNDNEYVVKSFKIMPRTQNAHAIVNAGFKFRLDKKEKYKILEQPSIVYGGIAPGFIHANRTEEFLNGKSILDESILEKALDILSGEINPDLVPSDPSPEYRKGLALSLFYKFILSLNPDTVNARYKSGGALLERGISSGKQDFDTNKTVWPLNKPVPKMEGIIQASGTLASWH